MKNSNARVMFVLMLMFTLVFANPMTLYATSLDELQSETTAAQQEQPSQPAGTTEVYPVDEGNALTDYMRGYTPITAENMAVASDTMSPIVSFCGTVAGAIMTFALAGIFVVTALDMVYIGLPFTRGFLNPQYAGGMAMQAGGGQVGGYGGYGGYGRGMMGGMMGGGMAQGQPAGGMEHGIRRKWISDEADYCVRTFAGGGMAQQPQMGGMMGGGMGMGMGMGMGGMQQPQQQAMPVKSVIGEYLKKRMLFIVIFAVCSVVLMSSILLDCGINLAELLQKVLQKVNGEIATVQI